MELSRTSLDVKKLLREALEGWCNGGEKHHETFQRPKSWPETIWGDGFNGCHTPHNKVHKQGFIGKCERRPHCQRKDLLNYWNVLGQTTIPLGKCRHGLVITLCKKTRFELKIMDSPRNKDPKHAGMVESNESWSQSLWKSMGWAEICGIEEIEERNPANVQELEQIAKVEWQKIPAEKCRKLLFTWPQGMFEGSHCCHKVGSQILGWGIFILVHVFFFNSSLKLQHGS